MRKLLTRGEGGPKFAVTSVMKIYTKCGNDGCIGTMIICIFHQLGILLRDNNPFSIKPIVVQVKISEKKHQFFRFEISLPF